MEHNPAADDGIRADNYKIFAWLSRYLNDVPDFIKAEEIAEIVQYGVSEEYAFAVILAGAFGLDIAEQPEDKALFNNYLSRMIHQLDAETYADNPYYKHIQFSAAAAGGSELKYEAYQPYEGFVCNDILRTAEGRQLPQIGFFSQEFRYPAILENGRIWMTVTPNEIETMREAVERAHGHVLAFGLGLGYYAYMVSEQERVQSVTVVDINPDVIALFKEHVLPQFGQARKIKVVQADAFAFAQAELPKGMYDFVFTDLWHDVSDGIDLYLRMKQYEHLSPGTEFMYWIEKSMLCYL
ncbi:hypothetical protein [Paenibacillus tengchongensis]|uniref:spermine/spermidine synthase domain-containing protein n=1 Tax=Paenibacillus tengchongensis TaxID=2608684 RepID=UPI00124DE9CE|nr:hypothetical protein [Paenibacillus tengchongensis]